MKFSVFGVNSMFLLGFMLKMMEFTLKLLDFILKYGGF